MSFFGLKANGQYDFLCDGHQETYQTKIRDFNLWYKEGEEMCLASPLTNIGYHTVQYFLNDELVKKVVVDDFISNHEFIHESISDIFKCRLTKVMSHSRQILLTCSKSFYDANCDKLQIVIKIVSQPSSTLFSEVDSIKKMLTQNTEQIQRLESKMEFLKTNSHDVSDHTMSRAVNEALYEAPESQEFSDNDTLPSIVYSVLSVQQETKIEELQMQVSTLAKELADLKKTIYEIVAKKTSEAIPVNPVTGKYQRYKVFQS
jgi:archaellum component FlaC